MKTAEKAEKLSLVPTPSRIIVEEDGFKYEGRVIIPETAQRRATTGTVKAVGENVTIVKVGDRILWAQFSGTVCNFRSHPAVRVLVEDEVLAIVKDDLQLEDIGA